jgi:hypothetical protein
MKKRSTLVLLGIASLAILFVACRKEINTPDGNEVGNTPLPTTGTYCRIESIWLNPGSSSQSYWLIAYDEFENPKFITTPLPATGQPFREFKYDGWHRLREYVGDYGNGMFEEWHFYGFDWNGRIGVDTNYVFGKLGEKPTNYFNRTISMIEYDSQGRIIRVTSHDDHGLNLVTDYSYDSHGNLIRPDVTYDNKVNLNRTNDYWMFLLRDYSMNNPMMADSYNAAGYPTVINSPNPVPWIIGDISHSQIGYGCRQSHYF